MNNTQHINSDDVTYKDLRQVRLALTDRVKCNSIARHNQRNTNSILCAKQFNWGSYTYQVYIIIIVYIYI